MPLSSQAAAPLEAVRAEINKVLDVLRDESLKGESGKNTKKTKIRSIANGMFDFPELARRTLGPDWKKLNAGQQKNLLISIQICLKKRMQASSCLIRTRRCSTARKEI